MHSHTIYTQDELTTALRAVFQREWQDLSQADQYLILRDCTEDGGVDDFPQYRRNIGPGNLASYARTMAVRFRESR